MTIINKGIFDTADVFLRQTGNDWPTAQVLSTSDITEGVNLYFTNARVNAAVSGNLALKANVSDLTSANISELTNLYYTNARVLSFVSSLLTTSNVAEGSNLYYTNARVYSNVIALLPSLAGSGIAIQANGQISANAVVVTFDSISQFLTTSNVAEGSNLYYTNARVNSNVIAFLPSLAGQNIAIEANGRISASVDTSNITILQANVVALAAQVISLANQTTSNIAEGTNLYYTNTRAVSAFSEGSGIAISAGGVISARGDSAGSGLFNSGIQLVGNTLAQSTFSNVKVFSFAEGNTFIGYSFHVTNITSNIVYLTGRHVFDSNTTLFANLLEMPVGSSMEVFRKPQVFRANDIIQIQGFDQNRTAVNNGISSYLSYQATVDDTYQRAGNTIIGNALTTIYQTVGRVSIFESINLVNLSPNVIYGTVIVTDGSDNIVAYLAANLAIPAYASVDVCEYPKTLLDDYKIKVQKSDNFNPLSVFTSSKFTQSFAVTPSSTNMTESGTITLDLVTTNIVNGTVLYYSITGASGNINQTDFVTNTTGTVTVQNNAVRLTLQANADLNTNLEGDETFTVVYRKNSNVGTVVATSSSIVLRDTSNVTSYALTDNTGGSAVLENSTIIFTLSTINLPPNTTYYYNSNGTVISSYFTAGNTGSFISNANTTYNIVFAGAGSIPDMTSATFKLEVRSGSLTGPILATSNTVTIVDAALADVQATGGNIIVANQYKVHTFTTSGNLTVSGVGTSGNIEYLVVAGGGGGGSNAPGQNGGAGGGGGGAVQAGYSILSSTGNITVTVGGGGAQPSLSGLPGSNSSILFGLSASIGNINIAGGAGGGSRAFNSGTGGSSGNGYTGGFAPPSSSNAPGGSGGGGAGGNGSPAITEGPEPGRGGGDGGTGVNNSILGSSNYYGGGGGGGNNADPNGPGGPAIRRGSGGTGGGGLGGSPAVPGVAYSGGGGGGAGSGPREGGLGGSGIVIIRYPYSAETYNFYTTNVDVSNTIIDNSNVIYNLQTINVNDATTLYWTLTGNVTNSDVIGGNTGSFAVTNSNANITIALANNITSGNATKSFALQIRKVSTTGAVVATANTVTVVSGATRSNFVSATGGTIVDTGTYRLHVFTSSSNSFTVTDVGRMGGYVDYLIVAGGGSGTYNNPGTGAGGGAGGLLTGKNIVTAQTYTAVVGAGGASIARNSEGNPGSTSTLFGYTSIGGGAGGVIGSAGLPGGSGGGSGGGIPSGTLAGGTGTTGQGYPGQSLIGNPTNDLTGGGGGGAGGTSETVPMATNTGRAGGIGLPISWVPNSYGDPSPLGQYFAGGGGGGSNPIGNPQPAPGGKGGGGRGGTGAVNIPSLTGNVNTGGGGGSAYNPSITGGAGGGSGIIIIRYPYV